MQSGVLGAIDELFHPEAHTANVVRQALKELPAPAPLAGGPDLGSGRIRIEVPVDSSA